MKWTTCMDWMTSVKSLWRSNQPKHLDRGAEPSCAAAMLTVHDNAGRVVVSAFFGMRQQLDVLGWASGTYKCTSPTVGLSARPGARATLGAGRTHRCWQCRRRQG